MKLATMSASAGTIRCRESALTSSRGRLRQQLQRLERPLAQGRGRALRSRDRSTAGFMVRLDARDQKRVAAHEIEHREALFALRDQMMRAVRRGDESHDRCGRADAVQLLRRGIVDRRVGLQQQSDAPLRAHRFLRRGERAACRPIATGCTTPGNSTRLRTGKMISTSSGMVGRRTQTHLARIHGVDPVRRRCRQPLRAAARAARSGPGGKSMRRRMRP